MDVLSSDNTLSESEEVCETSYVEWQLVSEESCGEMFSYTYGDYDDRLVLSDSMKEEETPVSTTFSSSR